MKNVETFYPLSPMQEGMLFHTLFDPGSGMYVEVLVAKIHGQLDVAAFKGAWQRSVDRHPILRTSFVWEGVKEPIQVVQINVEVPFTVLDWREFDPALQNTKTETLFSDERTRGFDLTHAPLIRLTLIRVADDDYHFIWTHHHILLDGWSIPILLGEVLQQYQAIQGGDLVRLPLVRPFKDYIVWLYKQDLTRSESFWRKQLSGVTEPTPLSFSRLDRFERGVSPTFAGIEILLPAQLTASLKDLARKNGLTLNTLIQGAWAVLLSRYCGEEDIVYGTTISGRPADLPGAEQMLGLFINTLPVRVDVKGNEKLLPWLQNLQASQAELRQYEYTPLVDIQNWSQVPRGTALFETLYVFENIPLSGLGGASTGSFTIEAGQSDSYTNFPLTFVAVPGEQISVKISYSTEWFDSELIKRMIGHYQAVLEAMITDPQRKISSIPLLSQSERQQILVDWNKTYTDYPVQETLAHLFEIQVQNQPDAPAVSFPDQQSPVINQTEDEVLSYRELNTRANQLAHYLQDYGIGPDMPVGIYMERSLMMVIATLAIIKAGGVYLPVDLSYPPERVAFMIADSQLSIVLTGQKYSDQLSKVFLNTTDTENQVTTPRIIILDDERERSHIECKSTENPISTVEADNLAYIMYTSGSTGRPKGVAVIQRGIIRLVKTTDYISFGPSDRVAHASNPSFDAATFEIWGALLNGAELVIVTRETALAPKALAAFLQSREISILLLTTALFNLLAHEIPVAFNTLKVLLTGGEQIDASSARSVLKAGKPRHFLNVYGPTESTTIATWYDILDIPEDAALVPIGKPIANTQIYILDQNLQPVPIGIPGELYIGGDGLAREYYHRPELTTEMFIENPFLEELDALVKANPDRMPYYRSSPHLYKTGDLVCFTPSGDILFLGRVDFQVKLHGLRIELGEIEAALSKYPSIFESIVLLREDSPGEKRLVAYLVPQPGAVIDLGDLRNSLKQKLPEFMIPAVFVNLDRLPINPNGKVDRKALPVPEGRRLDIGASYCAPETDQERLLAKIFAQVLKLDRVGALDNFFELGGDSILSLQVISLAKKEGLDISYRQLFEQPVIQELAREIDVRRKRNLEQGAVSGAAPLTPVQRWFFEHHSSAPHHFNVSIMVKVNIPLNMDLIKKSLILLIIHHDALRTRFEKTGQGWQQTIDEIRLTEDYDQNLPFDYQDYSSLEPQEQMNNVVLDAGAKQASIALNAPPLMNVTYYDLGEGQSHRLLFIFHHLIFDGVSARIFVDDFLSAYIQLMSGGQVSLPEKSTVYKTWAEKLTKTAQSDYMLRQLSQWISGSGSSYAPIPLDFPEGLNTYGLTEQVTVLLSGEETESLLHAAPSHYRVSTYAILLTAMTRLIHSITGSPEVLLELEGHGREEIAGTPLDGVDLSRTMGWFTSIYPKHFEIDPLNSFRDQVARVAEQLAQIPDRGIGFGLLRYLCEDAAVRQKLAEIPQPEVNFNYLGQFDQMGAGNSGDTEGAEPGSHQDDITPPIQIISEPVGFEQDPGSPRSAKLYVVAAISGGCLGVRWLYSRGQFRESTIQRYAEMYLMKLRDIMANGTNQTKKMEDKNE